MLPGFMGNMMMAGGAAAIPATYTANGIFSGTVATTIATITGVAFGTAGATRKVAIAWRVFTSAAITTASITIGGIAATNVGGLTQSGSSYSGIAYAVVPTGTSGTIVITTDNTLSSTIEPSVACWSIYDGDAAPTDSNSAVQAAATGARSVACTVPTGGYQFAAMFWAATGLTGITWTDATESDEVVSTTRATMAEFSPGAGSSHSVSTTPSASTSSIMQAFSWI